MFFSQTKDTHKVARQSKHCGQRTFCIENLAVYRRLFKGKKARVQEQHKNKAQSSSKPCSGKAVAFVLGAGLKRLEQEDTLVF